MKYKVQNNMSWQTIDGIFYLVDESTGNLFTLNEIAYKVWSGILENKSIEDIVQNIADAYQEDKYLVANDVRELLEGFTQKGFVSVLEG